MHKNCKYCKTEFYATRRDREYCSSACRQQEYILRRAGGIGGRFYTVSDSPTENKSNRNIADSRVPENRKPSVGSFAESDFAGDTPAKEFFDELTKTLNMVKEQLSVLTREQLETSKGLMRLKTDYDQTRKTTGEKQFFKNKGEEEITDKDQTLCATDSKSSSLKSSEKPGQDDNETNENPGDEDALDQEEEFFTPATKKHQTNRLVKAEEKVKNEKPPPQGYCGQRMETQAKQEEKSLEFTGSAFLWDVHDYIQSTDDSWLYKKAEDPAWTETLEYVNVRARSLFESLLEANERKRIPAEDFKKLAKAYGYLYTSGKFKALTKDYPFYELINDLAERLYNTVQNIPKSAEEVRVSLPRETRKQLIAARCVLRDYVPYVKFSELNFK